MTLTNSSANLKYSNFLCINIARYDSKTAKADEIFIKGLMVETRGYRKPIYPEIDLVIYFA